MTLKVAGAGLLALLVPSAVLAQSAVYKWKDAQGKVHFSNVQPGEGTTPGDATVVAPESSAPAVVDPAIPPPPARVVGEPVLGAPAATPGPYSNLEGDAFSTTVTRERVTLRRDLQAAKRELDQVTKEYESEILRKSVPTPAQVHDRIFQAVTGVGASAPDRQEEFAERKKRAEKRVADIRFRYSELENEAIKRYGSLPGWWLPIE